MSLEEYLAIHPKKYLIFDLDETLAWLQIDWKEIHQALFDVAKSIDPSLTTSPTKNGIEYFSLINLITNKQGDLAKKRLNTFIQEYEQRNYRGYTPNPALIAFIKAQKQNYSLSLWTSNTKQIVDDFLQKEQLYDSFNTIVTFESVKFTKHNPDGFYKIYDRNNIKSDYLMIGDSASDEAAAKAAGIDFFKVTYFAP